MTKNAKDTTNSTFAGYCLDSGVVPLKQDKVVPAKKSGTRVSRRGNSAQNKLSNSIYLLDDSSSLNEYYKDGQKQIAKYLRQGKYCILKTLDLHNYTQDTAITTLEDFINSSVTKGQSCLKIIHGKGLNSPDGKSVLKTLVRRFLIDHPRIIAYSMGNEMNGGDGVTLVKLKN